MKKRNLSIKLTSLLLALIMLIGTLPLNIIAFDSSPNVKILCDGSETNYITLMEDDKITLNARASHFNYDAYYYWEILVPHAGGTWVKIDGMNTEELTLTYALIANQIDESGCAYLRASARDGSAHDGIEDIYTSMPLTVSVTPLVTGDPETVAYNPADFAVTEKASTPARFSLRAAASTPGSAERFTITVRFIKVVNGNEIEVAHPDKRVLNADYEGYSVTCPSVLGYDSYSAYEGGVQISSVSVPAGLSSDTTYTVYYLPKEVKYTIYHYFQNVENDNYGTDVATISEERYGRVDSPVPDCHMTDAVGFHHLYYEHTVVAPDGSTVIEIYYDREYYTVLFDYGENQSGAYGQENLYVRYGKQIGINDVECAGYIFTYWRLDSFGGADSQKPAATINKDSHSTITVYGNIVYKANWTSDITSYKILYWRENADNGLYSLWTEKVVEDVLSGSLATWDGSIPTDDESQFFSLNSKKTRDELNERGNIIVAGDGSTAINVYFARKFYTITFLADIPATGCQLEEHSHTDGFCEFNPMYCTHLHTKECSQECPLEEHKHTKECKIICGLTEHVHNPSCCTTHMHTSSCYPDASTFQTGLESVIRAQVKEDWSFLGSWLGNIVDALFGKSIANTASKEGEKVMTMVLPKNVENGFIYIRTRVPITLNYLIDKRTSYFDIVAIYIDGKWYAYNGPIPSETKDGVNEYENKETGEIEVLEYKYAIVSSSCAYPDHDHTSGCEYTCGITEHTHLNSCYDCGEIEHEHNRYCTCTHEHDVHSYGNTCMKPEHNHARDDGKTGQTVRVLQAKYGQDITEYLPYYNELEKYALQTSGDQHFVGWQYAGKGWADKGETRYVKHVTMVSDLCYSEGVTATAVYSASATTPYKLYYYFESFDQTSGESDTRKKFGDTWYDNNELHHQLVMWNPADGDIPGTEKEIEGMSYAGSINIGNDYYFFYTRNTYYVTLENNGELTEVTKFPIPYGTPFSMFKEALDSAGVIDVDSMPYPAELEPDAYVPAGWYTTPSQNVNSKVNWDEYTMPVSYADEGLLVYYVWQPVTRNVNVYLDSSKSTLICSEGVPHRNFATDPESRGLEVENGDLVFSGWFYVDSHSGEETAFLFTFPVTHDMDIYAKWTSNTVVYYRVNYLTQKKNPDHSFVYDENGDPVYLEIATPTIGSAIAGQNKTFRAKTGASLYADYQEGFFPRTGSHTIQMMHEVDGSGNDIVNTFNFIYDEVEKVPYVIEYRDADTNEELSPAETLETRYAAVTELFIPIADYTVDKYSKTLILSVGDNAETENVITFYYTKNEVYQPIQAPWLINHYIQNLDGSYQLYSSLPHTDTITRDTDPEVLYGGTPLENGTVAGYSFQNATVKTRVKDGDTTVETESALSPNSQGKYEYALNEYGMEINFYYTRNKVGYKIVYMDAETSNVLYSKTVSASDSAVHGSTVSAVLDENENMTLAVRGYSLVGEAREKSIVLNVDESRNIIYFYYEKFDSKFTYIIICGDGSDPATIGVQLSFSGTEYIDANSNASTVGSHPIEDQSSAYYFAGWFLDEACTKPITAETIERDGIPARLENDHLYPEKTTFKYAGQDYSLYIGTEYYALFLPKSAPLTIRVNSGRNDAFILTFRGKEGSFAYGNTFTVAVKDGFPKTIADVPIGFYTVELDTNWSWRYGEIPDDDSQFEVRVSEGAQVVINMRDSFNGASRWLDDTHYSQSLYIKD